MHKYKDVPHIDDVDGKDDFTEGNMPPTSLPHINLDKETIDTYKKVFQKDTTFFERFGNFIRAENKAGRKAKIIKDFLLIFVPYGRTISSATEMATEIITEKQNNMLQDKKWYESKTIWSAVILVITSLLQAFGVDLMANPELTATIYEVAMLLAGAGGLYGLRDAIGKQKKLLNQDKQ